MKVLAFIEYYKYFQLLFYQLYINIKCTQIQLFNIIIYFILMLFLYRVQIKDSSLQGKGVFALEDIPAGVVYMDFKCQNPLPVKGHFTEENHAYSKEQLEAVCKERISGVLHGGLYYADGDVFIEFKDGTQFTNHSDLPNSKILYPASRDYRQVKSVTLRKILKGQEIYQSYSDYFSKHSPWVINLMEKYYPSRIEFQEGIMKKMKGDDTK